MKSYSAEQVAAEHLPEEWSDRVRWLKRRLASGEIPGKQISRGVWRMTEAHIAAWLVERETETDSAPVEVDEEFTAGLSERSKRRLLRTA